MFYDNLKAICDMKNIKITPLVLECGGTKGVIGGWKRGAAPNSDIVMRLSVRLNVPTDVLLFGKKKCAPAELLSTDEQELLTMYKNMTDINKARLLERGQALIEQQPQIRTAYVAARSFDNEPPSVVTGDFSDVLNATDATDEY